MNAADSLVDHWLIPTPGGAYAATSTREHHPARKLLLALMAEEQAPRLTARDAAQWCGLEDESEALELIGKLERYALVQVLPAARHARGGTIEQLLPDLLGQLCDSGRALLADAQGLHVASTGFPGSVVASVSALAADLASLADRYDRLLIESFNRAAGNWALVDAAGNSRLGAWTLHIGQHRFVLVLEGMPRLNRPEYVELVWALVRRYALVAAHIPTGASRRATVVRSKGATS